MTVTPVFRHLATRNLNLKSLRILFSFLFLWPPQGANSFAKVEFCESGQVLLARFFSVYTGLCLVLLSPAYD